MYCVVVCVNITTMKRRRFNISKMPEHIVWKHMLYRCRNPNHPAYKNYGGRGIEVKFDSFSDFYEEVGPKPAPSADGPYSIHRIYNNGNYEKGNVKWATWKEQSATGNKRRRTKVYILEEDHIEISSSSPVQFLHTRPFFDFINRKYGRNISLD